MKKILLYLALFLSCLAGALGFIRFIVGGDEDNWICVQGQWLRHGNPSAPMPTGQCQYGK